MKKLLLGSTALVAGGLMAAPAMAADPIKIGVGGYYQFFAMAGSIEGVYAPDGTSIQYKGLQFIQEGEIHFIGQSKLDNGTTVGLTVELEGSSPAMRATTDDMGRAEFKGVPAGTRVKAVASVAGERIESQEFAMPGSGGIRLALVAAGPAGSPSGAGPSAAAPDTGPVQPGDVVLGEDT